MTESFPKTIGRYEIIERLAVGGMAELFLAHPRSTSASPHPVVIKRLLPHIASDPHFNAMFIHEAKLTNRLAHPNIAGTYELGRQGDQLYMVMEYVEGIDCLIVLRECAQKKMRLPPEASVYIAYEVLDALDFAHNALDDNGEPLQVIHRDISPSNVILSRHGEVKLLDFGIARAARQEHRTKDGTLKGKYGYMSPEQVLEEEIDARSDLFSVGIVLAELLTGRRLFAARNDLDVLLMVRDVRLARLERYGGHIDSDLDGVLRKALAKKREDRYTTAAEFRSALGAWMAKHKPKTSAKLIAQIVSSLADGAQRHEPQKMGDRGSALVAVAEDRADNKWVVDRVADEMPHVELIQGIPAGRLVMGDSLPVVSIVQSPAPAGEPRGTGVSGLSDGVVAEVVAGDESMSVTMEDLLSEPVIIPEIGNPLSGGDSRDFDKSLVSAVESLASGAPAGKKQAQSDRPDDEGDFAESPPIAVLYRLATARASGLLSASVGGIRKDVYFRSGIPEFVSSNINSERFGEYLVNQGVLTTKQLSRALGAMPRFQGKLGDTLVALGFLEPLEVFRHLTKQVRHKLIDLCTWGRGAFAWYGGRENPIDAFPLDLNAFEIMGAAAMQLPDVVVHHWLERLPLGCRPHVVRHHRIGIEVFQLGEFLSRVFESLKGDSYLAELQLHYREHNERERFIRALYLLAQTRLVAFGD